MSFESDLVARLEADAGVSALVGTRIYPLNLPQAASLAGDSLTYEVISNIEDENLSGPADRESPRVRVHCWSTTFAGAVALATAVRAALVGFRGTMGSTPVGMIAFETSTDLYEDQPDTYRRILDFRIAHR